MKEYQVNLYGKTITIIQDTDGKFVTPEIIKEQNKFGTTLKPAYEPIIVARKPIEKSVAENVLKYGCGAINIDECRIPTSDDLARINKTDNGMFGVGVGNNNAQKCKEQGIEYDGRFPSNVILTYDETDFDEVCGGMPTSDRPNGNITKNYKINNQIYGNYGYCNTFNAYQDSGSASRYFYCAKASKKDRDEGLDMFEEKQTTDGCIRENSEAARMYGANSISKKNIHPTVKPIDLMQYLVRMFTPKGGAILEPFAGSGSTGKATMFENRERNANYTITMIEITHEYIPIIKARCDYAINKYKYDDEKALRERKEKGELNIFDFDYGE